MEMEYYDYDNLHTHSLRTCTLALVKWHPEGWRHIRVYVDLKWT